MILFFNGFTLGASLIIAIGAQNAYVLSQSLKRQHHRAIALTCALCDAILIAIAVAGMGELLAYSPKLAQALRYGGAVFLIWYGAMAFKAVWSQHSLKAAENQKAKPLKAALVYTLAITLLNPHVYIDTILLLGGISTQYAPEARPLFAFGAITASFVWFLTLAYGASLLAPYLARPITWKVIDFMTGVVMWIIAIQLLFS